MTDKCEDAARLRFIEQMRTPNTEMNKAMFLEVMGKAFDDNTDILVLTSECGSSKIHIMTGEMVYQGSSFRSSFWSTMVDNQFVVIRGNSENEFHVNAMIELVLRTGCGGLECCNCYLNKFDKDKTTHERMLCEALTEILGSIESADLSIDAHLKDLDNECNYASYAEQCAVKRQLHSGKVNAYTYNISFPLKLTGYDKFIEWLKSNGHSVSVGLSEFTTVNGVNTDTNHECHDIMNELWDNYIEMCNNSVPPIVAMDE